jgi:dihydroxyacetone kinase-like predicted kinase
MGLVFMLEGMLRFIRGEEMEFSAQEVSANGQHWQETLVPKSEEGYGYDVQFLMHGTGMNVAAVRDAINSMGWSTLVVGDDGLIKVHVHVHDPGKPISYAIGLGAMLDDVVVENLHQQYRQYVEERIARETDIGKPPAGVAVIAVASGDGLRRLFTEELHAAKIISGGQTMNPSTEDFLTAMDALPNQDIILLPNNKNIVLATRQAAALSRGKNVHVVPSCTLPQGIAAMVAYTSLYETGTLDEIDAAMQDAINHVMSVEITTAVRDSKFDTLHVRTGQVIGLLDGKLVAAGNTLAEVVHMVLRIAHAEQHELITLYYGSDVSADDAQSLADALTVDFSKQEFIVIQGEQPLYPYLISVE